MWFLVTFPCDATWIFKVSVKDRCLLLELVWSTRAYSTVTSRGFSMFSCSFLLRHRHLSGDHVEISFYSLIMGKMLVKCIMASSLGSTWLKLKGTVCIASSCKHPPSLLYGSIFWRKVFRNEYWPLVLLTFLLSRTWYSAGRILKAWHRWILVYKKKYSFLKRPGIYLVPELIDVNFISLPLDLDLKAVL